MVGASVVPTVASDPVVDPEVEATMVPTVMPCSDPVVDPDAEAKSLVTPCSDPVIDPEADY